jgi:hypothetical protein
VSEAQDRLTEAEDAAARARLGPSLDWTDAELDDLADVGPADIADAAAAWKRDAPPALRGLIDAEPADAEPADEA